jgi:hypothetical protein
VWKAGFGAGVIRGLGRGIVLIRGSIYVSSGPQVVFLSLFKGAARSRDKAAMHDLCHIFVKISIGISITCCVTAFAAADDRTLQRAGESVNFS